MGGIPRGGGRVVGDDLREAIGEGAVLPGAGAVEGQRLADLHEPRAVEAEEVVGVVPDGVDVPVLREVGRAARDGREAL